MVQNVPPPLLRFVSFLYIQYFLFQKTLLFQNVPESDILKSLSELLPSPVHEFLSTVRPRQCEAPVPPLLTNEVWEEMPPHLSPLEVLSDRSTPVLK